MTTAAIAAEILARIAGHDSKRPARADDVAALVGGDEPAYWAAVELLKASSQINCAHIKRGTDPEPWLAIWPTGIPARMDTWHDLNARGHFNTRRPFTQQRMPQTLASRLASQEIEMKQKPDTTEQRRDYIVGRVLGLPLAEGVPLKAIAEELGLSVEGVRHLVKTMEGGLRVARGKIPGEHCHRLYDPKAKAPAGDHFRDATKMMEPPAPAEPIGAPESELCPAQPLEPLEPADLSTLADFLSAAADAIGDMEPADDIDISAAAAQVAHAAPQQTTFALWDDGGLSIYDGDDLLQLPPADVARLARLLGVPGCQLASGVAA